MLASYASLPQNSRGRQFRESQDTTRDCYQKDRDRIIHSSLFRKLMYKTQVFVNYEGDYYRTRLTHSLEVAQIARSIARRLKVNEDLTETLALAHDIGHPPFGHAGEDAMCSAAGTLYKFDHNAQAIRSLTHLEGRYIGYNGLNLTWESIEGLVKHNGPIEFAHQIIDECNKTWDLELKSHSSLEAQIASISDDIAYNTHDLDDGIRANLISYDDLKTLPIIASKIKKIEDNFQDAPKNRILYKAIRKTVGDLIEDVVNSTSNNINKFKIKTNIDIRQCNEQVACFSSEAKGQVLKIRGFLHNKIYSNYRVNRTRFQAKRIIKDLFDVFYNEPTCLPKEWQPHITQCIKSNAKAQVVCDFIAGMTDRFAIQEHQKFFDTKSLLKSHSTY